MKPIPSFRVPIALVFCLSLSPVLLTVSSAAAAELRAGLARIDITPKDPVMLAGYASRTNLSQGVHDPLSARALAFEQDGRRLVLVSIDNLGFYSDTAAPLRRAILEACRLEPSELFLCAIHTHSAPSLTLERGHPNNVAYTKALRGQLVEVVRTALDRLAPAQLTVGSGSSPVGSNRRQVVPANDGKSRIVLGRNPSVLTDREVQVLKLTRPGGDELAGVLFAYATHSTSLGPRNYIVSGDVHGLAEQFVERYLGNEIVAPGFAGASGNVDPWFRVMPEFKTTNGWVPEPVLLGTMLGEEVAHVLTAMPKPIAVGPIKSRFKTVELSGKARGESQEPAGTTPFNISVARVGEIGFVGWGGEVFNEIGKAVKEASPFRQTFVFTHCNGAAGYVPIRTAYTEGGYEVQSSSFAPGAAERLIEETTRMLKEL